MNITLIGMPGVGKSTIGVVLAKTLGMRFLDTDLLIMEQTKQRLPELIAERGTAGFCALEETVLSGIDVSDTVIATGGSAVYGTKAMRRLAQTGPLVYLRISCEELTPRLGDLAGRGVVIQEGADLQSLYAERCPLYERAATHVLDVDGLSLREAAESLALMFQSPTGSVFLTQTVDS